MQSNWRGLLGAILLFVIPLFLISYVSKQDDFILSFSSYSIAFIVFLYFIRIRNNFSIQIWKSIAFVLFLIPLFSIPSLSPDVYRFLWDGELVTMGIHPYSAIPNELMESNDKVYNSEYMNSLYAEITELSRRNYSIYPSVNQFYFLISALISDNLIVSLITLRVLMLATLLIGAHYFFKILELLSISISNSVLLILNPILIVEIMGNFHFEGIMLSFLFVGVYFVLKNKWLKSSLFWAIAINIKLTPLILLPFLIRFRKLKISIQFYIYTFLFSSALLLIYLWPSVFSNFMQSIELYFDNFEFNAGIFYLVKWITSFFIEGNPTLIVGPTLSILAFIYILIIAFYKPIKTNNEWLNRMMWGYVVYLLFATTVHPWYVILPLGLAVFSVNLGVLFWSFLIMLSYGFYAFGQSSFGYVLIGIEYLILLWFLLFPNNFMVDWSRKVLRIG
ncbi:polyprenol phosphomannose-dependent alpha 1,6 mannosyltransferase MptB [Brumimicrobium mesophilum]|uniref:polyprenol phosphomannose-dependent alpha 1,6 mannosyltransferase MptB n=1 Tax=Brumimicrobium mesophilum TaxID=392717 RepID=UPI000D140C2F|nr:polyprenol phosphomannose-dependent alpha 1,6 mannosyltransferase MptB [Brumimicrobium mesophilum]